MSDTTTIDHSTGPGELEDPETGDAQVETPAAGETAAGKTAARKTAAEKTAVEKTAASSAEQEATQERSTGAGPTAARAATSRQLSITVSVRGVIRVLAVLVILGLAAAAIVFGVLWSRGHDLEQARGEASASSTHFVEELVTTLNAADADQYTARMTPLATGKLKANLEAQRSQTQQNVAEMNLKVTPSIWSSSVQEATTSRATTVVIAEVTGTSKTAVSPVTETLVFRLHLEKHGSRWLVADFEGLQGGDSTQAGGTQAGGTQTGGGQSGGTQTDGGQAGGAQPADPAATPGG
ncbi:hypothetical protein [Gordonia jinhuaensis]|uniref:hypothetical protein n=1 Tax=Gordonia jinhuaensis TaxID=1517702 RepID=UPI0016668953|nr:hypothetical protein [Gordonia jinhuaensis]